MITAFNYHFSEKTEIIKASTKFTGIGRKMALQVLDRVGISSNIKIAKLSASQLAEIKATIEQYYDVNSERQQLIRQNISRLSSISSYRGIRHNSGLPSRGQRTHSNAKTAKKLKGKIKA